MKIRHIIFSLALMVIGQNSLIANPTNADEGELQAFSWIELHAGSQITPTNANNSKLFTPIGGISIGRYFFPQIGGRLHVSGLKAKGGFEPLGQYYEWSFWTSDLDLMVNVTAIANNRNDNILNLIAIAGIGLTASWDNDELLALDKKYNALNNSMMWKDNHKGRNLRFGIRLETDHTRPFGASVEFAANNTDDKFNSKYANSSDWMLTGTLGVSYRFGRKFRKSSDEIMANEPEMPISETSEETATEETTPVVEETPSVEKPTEKQPTTRIIERRIPVSLHEEHFYAYREVDNASDDAQMRRIADFLTQHPEATITVTGYADKETGTAAANARFARQRAENFKRKLVESYKADATRIITDSKGDTVQPFPQNDRNRCVIVEGKAEETITETITE